MKHLLLLLVFATGIQTASAFPTWMGVFGSYQRHDDSANPGQFTILMNRDYPGLQARVGIQVNGGNWVVYPMRYAGNVQGNSLWTFTPSFQFPAGATVRYYFQGTDRSGRNIWDSRNGQNYQFTVPATTPIVQRLADGLYVSESNGNGITTTHRFNFWLDFSVRRLGDPEAIGIVWTWNNWADWRSATAVKEADLPSGYERWGVDITPIGDAYFHRSLGFARWYPAGSTNFMVVTNSRLTIKYAIFYRVGGTWYWDNNNGQDHSLTIGSTADVYDSDADGLADSWEREHFGHLLQGPEDNPDGDGPPGMPMANIVEFLNGTNPRVPEDTSARGVRLVWGPAYPAKGGTVTLSYAVGHPGSPLFGKPIYAHVGYNNWQGVYQTAQLTPNGFTGRHEITIPVPPHATELNIVFTDKNGSWDNNGGRNWKILVRP